MGPRPSRAALQQRAPGPLRALRLARRDGDGGNLGLLQRISPLVRGLLLGAAIVTLVPALTHEPWKLRIDEPRFFASDGAQKTCIRRGDNVLVLPYFNAALHWQQADGFRYRLAAP